MILDITFTVFCNTSMYNNDIKVFQLLNDNFLQEGFVATNLSMNTFQIGLGLPGQGINQVINRPQLKNLKNNDVINIMPERIDYVISAKIDENTIHPVTLADMNEKKNVMFKLTNLLGVKGSRIALNINNFEEGKKIIDKDQINIFYHEKHIIEFNSRIVARVSSSIENEDINVIYDVTDFENPLPIQIAGVMLNKVGVLQHADINTSPENIIERFGETEMEKIFNNIIDIYQKMMGVVGNVQ